MERRWGRWRRGGGGDQEGARRVVSGLVGEHGLEVRVGGEVDHREGDVSEEAGLGPLDTRESAAVGAGTAEAAEAAAAAGAAAAAAPPPPPPPPAPLAPCRGPSGRVP